MTPLYWIKLFYKKDNDKKQITIMWISTLCMRLGARSAAPGKEKSKKKSKTVWYSDD